MGSMSDFLVEAMQSGKFSDLVFQCRGEEFKVHKIIVCSQSVVISAAIDGNFEVCIGAIRIWDHWTRG